MSEIRVTSVVGENGGDRVGLTTGLTVGPLTGTTGIGATISHQGHAQFSGVCTATSFSGSGASLTNIPVSTGGIIQVKNTTLTSAYSDNTNAGAIWSFNNDLLRVTITASSASNFFLITGQVVIGSNGLAVSSMLYDNNSPVTTSGSRGDAASNRRQSLSGDDSGNTEGVFTIPIHAYISCADTNEHKFHYAFWHNSGGQNYIHLNRSHTDTDTNKRGRYISNITVMEIKG